MRMSKGKYMKYGRKRPWQACRQMKCIFTNSGLKPSPHPEMLLFLHSLSSTLGPCKVPAHLPGMSIQHCPSVPNSLPPFPVPHSLCYTFCETLLFTGVQEKPMDHQKPSHLSTPKWHFYVSVRVLWMYVASIWNWEFQVAWREKNINSNMIFSFP